MSGVRHVAPRVRRTRLIDSMHHVQIIKCTRPITYRSLTEACRPPLNLGFLSAGYTSPLVCRRSERDPREFFGESFPLNPGAPSTTLRWKQLWFSAAFRDKVSPARRNSVPPNSSEDAPVSRVSRGHFHPPPLILRSARKRIARRLRFPLITARRRRHFLPSNIMSDKLLILFLIMQRVEWIMMRAGDTIF